MALKRILLCPPRIASVPKGPLVRLAARFTRSPIEVGVWQSSITDVLLHPVPSFCVHLHHGILGGRRLGWKNMWFRLNIMLGGKQNAGHCWQRGGGFWKIFNKVILWVQKMRTERIIYQLLIWKIGKISCFGSIVNTIDALVYQKCTRSNDTLGPPKLSRMWEIIGFDDGPL